MYITIKDVIGTNIAVRYNDGVLVRQRYIDGDILDFKGIDMLSYDCMVSMLKGVKTPLQVINTNKEITELLWLYLGNGLHKK